MIATEIRKAAILLMSLPEEQAAQLLGRLQPNQVEAVSLEIAQLGRVGSEEQEAIIQEFAESNPHSLASATGGMDLAQSLLQKALGKNATGMVETVRQSIEARPFGFLKKVDPQNLITFLSEEHPQTIALVLSHLPAAYGAEVLAGLPTERQLAVARRIAHMGQTNPAMIQEVEQGLENRMASLMKHSFQNAGGVGSVAEILNVSDRATERALLENLGQEDPDLVEEIRRLMFVFDDITKLSDKDVQKVIKNVESGKWAMALKGANPDLINKILSNMSQRAATMLREEMEYLGPVRLSEVESVQQQIVDIVRQLEDTGEIAAHGGEEDEEFVQ